MVFPLKILELSWKKTKVLISTRSFTNYSLQSVLLFFLTLILFNAFIYITNDKIYSAKLVLIIAYINSFIHYCYFYKIKERLFFFLVFLASSVFFRIGEFNIIKLFLILGLDHNISLLGVLGLSHIIKYFYYQILINLFRLDMS